MEDTVLGHQLAIGMITSWLLEVVKNSPYFPWITQETDRLNRWISVSVAFLSTVGIQAALSGHLSFETGATVTLTIPPLSVVFDTFLHCISQIGIQQATYKGLIKKDETVKAKPQIRLET